METELGRRSARGFVVLEPVCRPEFRPSDRLVFSPGAQGESGARGSPANEAGRCLRGLAPRCRCSLLKQKQRDGGGRANAGLRSEASLVGEREGQPPPPQKSDGITRMRPLEDPVVDIYRELTEVPLLRRPAACRASLALLGQLDRVTVGVCHHARRRWNRKS